MCSTLVIIIVMDWVRQHITAIAVVLGLIVLIVAGIWFWGVLIAYVSPTDAKERKDVVQTLALIAAGFVGAIGGIVGIANLRQQRDLEEQRAQEDALQAYLEQIGSLLKEQHLVNTDREDLKQLAQAQTLTVLARLDGNRKGTLVRFLYGAGLITKNKPVLDLSEADLRDAYLYGANLTDANLRRARLSRAKLGRAKLDGADLAFADLRKANLYWASLEHASLAFAELFDANLANASLSGADLNFAWLNGADLRKAALSSANLSDVKLDRANVTEEQLADCESLKFAIMPDGQTYEDWRKTRPNFRPNGPESPYRGRRVAFQEAERRYAELKRQFDARTIGVDEFNAERQRLMVQDDEGRWWATNPNNNEWTYFDGSAWVPGTPPGY
jgi:uncharacterized protein YjbI with pentapeptide repeats